MRWNLPQRAYVAIGRVVSESADLDHEMTKTLDELVGAQRAELLTAGQNFAFIYEALRRITQADAKLADLKPLISEAKELHELRDLVVHGLWLPSEQLDFLTIGNPTQFLTVRPRRWKSHLEGKHLALDDLERLAEDLERVTRAFHDFRLESERQRSGLPPVGGDDAS